MTAIVWSSGSGKTTILNMLLGLYQPNEGNITIDGVHFSEFELASWRKQVGFVSQEMVLFRGSIFENVQFLNDRTTLEEVKEKCQTANIHEFIENLPEGYDTIIGERGIKLSGGQRQRIAIARALIGNPEILIFDEATSALDNTSEKTIKEDIESLAKNRTIIVVAHRLSSIINSDKIIVLDKGQIIEEGTHKILMEMKGHYFKNFQTLSS